MVILHTVLPIIHLPHLYPLSHCFYILDVNKLKLEFCQFVVLGFFRICLFAREISTATWNKKSFPSSNAYLNIHQGRIINIALHLQIHHKILHLTIYFECQFFPSEESAVWAGVYKVHTLKLGRSSFHFQMADNTMAHTIIKPCSFLYVRHSISQLTGQIYFTKHEIALKIIFFLLLHLIL